MDVHILLLVLSLIILISSPHFSSSLVSNSSLKKGSSLSVEDILVSPSGVFSAGFLRAGDNAYYFSIWFSKPSCTTADDCTIVWMGNRDFPVNGKRSKLWLLETGNLVLIDGGDKSIAWYTNAVSRSAPSEVILYDSGNLVLQNMEGAILWQSFDFPTDTLLPLQNFTKNMQLVSSRSKTNFSSGFYKLFFNNDNLLRLLYDGVQDTSIYWPIPWLVSWAIKGRFAYNSRRFAFLDSSGKFTSSDNFSFLSTEYGETGFQRRLTIDFDGNLRLYSRKENSNSWVVAWQALTRPCEVHGICGANSMCKYDPFSGRKCSCLPGYKVKNSADWSSGCEPEVPEIKNLSCQSIPESRNQVGFIKLTHVEFYGYDYAINPGYTFRMCKQLCLSLCECKGFEYKYVGNGLWNLFSAVNNIRPTTWPTMCYIKMALLNGQRSPSFDGDFYLKVPKNNLFSKKEEVLGFGLNCSSEIVRPIDRIYTKSNQNEKLHLLLRFATILGVVEIIGILLVWRFLNSSFHHQHSNNESTAQGYQTITGFKRFAYSELKKATANVKMEIGRGAGGIVYEGTLSENRVAAIKRLNFAGDRGEAEFLAEVSAIGKLNHKNLIEMWGYCAEKKHRLLVYKYMKHGSLSENLSSKALDWQKRFQIAIGTARALAYLHEECLEWVLHCDVKPENILLDSKYQPKVSDFGLSKLLNREDNNPSFSRMRGTRGYMAPEWVLKLPITSKVDVYSYGIVVLEMVTGKSPTMEEKTGLATWVREKKNGGESWIEEILDPKLVGEYDRDEVEILVTLALQCVEEDKDSRPTMSKVVETLLRNRQH
ncbi:hypothetical protein JCGZ_17630 [Jatropha curcas]|uniref:Receptor-like serine/threonine-protein kinase n=1 Tax=Jatropha curcas TaxID=180498 RepID=A0A067JRF9_JATCU|nr:hypothetical protein JCGZ_17630 [Jatropha curcas]